MFIHETISTAMARGFWIARAKWSGWLKVEPTNSDMGFILHGEDKAPCPRWQPQAEDLIADDWILVSGD